MPSKSPKHRKQKVSKTGAPQPRAAQQQPAHRASWQDLSFDPRRADPAFPNVPLRWLLRAFALTLLAVVVCAWALFGYLYWQGSWQLLYHPVRTVERTPASRSLPFQWIHLDADETGITHLTAWWIPAGASIPQSAVLVLHGADGNLADTLPLDAWLHTQNQSVLAIDYRGYGRSSNGKPSEKQLRHDALAALHWLADTKHIPHGAILVWGTGIGADLAAQLGSDPSLIGGVILDQPIAHPLDVLWRDPRSRLVPARLLQPDRYDLDRDAAAVAVPSLWLLPNGAPRPTAYERMETHKTAAWLQSPFENDPNAASTFTRWLDSISSMAGTPRMDGISSGNATPRTATQSR